MLSANSTAMIGKAVCWRFARTDLLAPPVAVTKVVADLEAALDVEGFEVALVVPGVASEATVDAVATEVEEGVMVVRLLEVSMMLLLQALPLRHRTPSPTTQHLEEK